MFFIVDSKCRLQKLGQKKKPISIRASIFVIDKLYLMSHLENVDTTLLHPISIQSSAYFSFYIKASEKVRKFLIVNENVYIGIYQTLL